MAGYNIIGLGSRPYDVLSLSLSMLVRGFSSFTSSTKPLCPFTIRIDSLRRKIAGERHMLYEKKPYTS